MGQQLNKIQKRRRRLNYLERKAAKAKETVAAAKPVKKKAAPKKAGAAEAVAAE
jgi:hypothetical protein